MLKLILFAACERVLVGDDNSSSLISILENVIVSGQTAGEMLPNAGLPMRWAAICLWYRAKETSQPIQYESKVDLFSPNGEPAMGGSFQFIVSNEHLRYRSSISFPLFPIGQEGIHWLKLSLKKVNAKKWEQVGEYPIDVVHNIKELKIENENENKHTVESV